MVRQSVYVITFVIGLIYSASLSAQSVMLLEVDTDLPDADRLEFESALSTALHNHPDFAVEGKRDLTVSELALAVGCASPDEACLNKMASLIDSDFVAFGSMNESGDAISAEVKIYDFSGKYFAERRETIRRERLAEGLRALVDNALWGESGEIQIAIAGADDFTVYLNGEQVEPDGGVIHSLPYGRHTVSVETESDRQSFAALVRPGKLSHADFVFDTPSSIGRSTIPGIVLLAAGLGAVGFGVAMSVSLQSDQNEIDRIEDTYRDPSCDCFAQPLPETEHDRFIDLDGKRTTKTALQFVGYGAGAALTGIGTYLLIKGLKGDSESTRSAFQLELGPTSDGARVGGRFSF